MLNVVRRGFLFKRILTRFSGLAPRTQVSHSEELPLQGLLPESLSCRGGSPHPATERAATGGAAESEGVSLFLSTAPARCRCAFSRRAGLLGAETLPYESRLRRDRQHALHFPFLVLRGAGGLGELGTCPPRFRNCVRKRRMPAGGIWNAQAALAPLFPQARLAECKAAVPRDAGPQSRSDICAG